VALPQGLESTLSSPIGMGELRVLSKPSSWFKEDPTSKGRRGNGKGGDGNGGKVREERRKGKGREGQGMEGREDGPPNANSWIHRCSEMQNDFSYVLVNMLLHVSYTKVA